MMLTPDALLDAYDTKDRDMRSALAVPEVQAFATGTFDQIGWPHSVMRAAHLIRYADWCNHPGANDYFVDNAVLPTQCARLQFTAAEEQLLRRVSDACAAVTGGLGREVRVLLNHLAQIGPFRIVMELQKRLGIEQLNFFDVGAGSGYQAAMQLLAGNRVLVTDNAQGLFLFQSLVLEACGKGPVRNWLIEGPPQGSLEAPVHLIPWWDYLGLRHRDFRNVDIFFSNNNLGEMNYAAAAYTVFLARKMMVDSKAKLFFFTCLGTPKQSSLATIEALFRRAGFVNLLREPFWLYTVEGYQLPPDLLDFVHDIPRWKPEEGEVLRTVRQVIDVHPDSLPTDLDFVSFTGVFDLAKALASQSNRPQEPPKAASMTAVRPSESAATMATMLSHLAARIRPLARSGLSRMGLRPQ